ncbi:MAG: cation:proton antiporter [Sideroxyarcus sp.]|nr:cation:proton antiporter [Sideroxyarcus sp.]
MITTLLMVAAILFLALQLEEKLSVPSPLGLLVLSFAAHYLFQQVPVLTGDAEHFAALVIFLLPILLISDSLEVKVADLKEHAWSLLYLTVVSVVLSVLMALSIADWLFADYQLSTASIIVLFAMVLATDPVSVVSVFSRFELPHRLKILAEGESLLNDATALVVFVFVGLYALGGGEIGTLYVLEVSAEVLLGSVAAGMAMGFLGLVVMKSTQNRIAEIMVLLITGYGAFEIAEHFYVLLNLLGGHSHLHLSGILAVIFATITVNHVMTRSVEEEDRQIAADEAALQREARKRDASSGVIGSVLSRIRATLEERDRHLRSKEDVQLLALVANTILFIAMAEMIDLNLLWRYKTEILVMFAATTVIRGVMMGLFAAIAGRTEKMVNISLRWWSVLTFAGIKGGLSIVMLTMIPSSFPQLEMFKAVVIGVIMLSTFVYSGALIMIIGGYQDSFLAEKNAESGTHT